MSTVQNRQRDRQEQAPQSNPFVRYDPVADIPNQQGQLTQQQPAIPGGGPQNQLAPEAQEQTPPPAPRPQREIDDPAMAYAVWELLQKKGVEGLGEEKYRSGLTKLATFEAAYPGQLQRYKDGIAAQGWLVDNLDTTPAPDSRLKEAQRQAYIKSNRFAPGRAGQYMPPSQVVVPKSSKDLPKLESGSRAAVIDRLEREGVDTTSGVTSFREEFDIARRVNGSKAQLDVMYAMAYDNLEQAGITLPKGLDPLNYNHDLGQLEMLVPTDEGKVRRVLVEPEFMRLQDLGSAADIEEAMATVGSVLSQIVPESRISRRPLTALAQSHPALAEFFGDFGWRNTGILMEYMLDADWMGGQTSLADVNEAISGWGNFGESAFNTASSRVFGRIFGTKDPADVEESLNRFRRVGDKDAIDALERSQDVINKNIQDAGDTVEELNKLTDHVYYVDRGAATGSKVETAVQKGREARLTEAEQVEMEIIRQANKDALSDAVDNIHKNALPTSPSKHPAKLEQEIQSTIKAPAEAAGDISVSRSRFVDEGREDIETLIWSYNRGTGIVDDKAKIGPDGKKIPNEMTEHFSGAEANVDRINRTVTLNWIGEDKAFPGSSPFLMKQMMEDLGEFANEGYAILADKQLSQFSMNALKSLEKEGIQIRWTPDLKTRVDGDITWTTGPGGREPVAQILEIPGYYTHIPLVEDTAAYSASRQAGLLDDSLENLAEVQGRADFWGWKLKAQIGWQPERSKSIYSIVNPPSSKLHKVAREISSRAERALTGKEVSEADALLGSMYVRMVDEEGNTVIKGLTEKNLDIGNLMTSRDTLRAMYERTNDPMVKTALDEVDRLLKDGKMIDNFGNPVDAAKSTGIRSTMEHVEQSTESLRRIESGIVSNPMFKKNIDGEYINVDIKTMGNMLKSSNDFMRHIKPWLHGNPQGQVQMQGALMDVYRDTVLSGTGFTAGKHATFLRNYRTALEEVFTPDDLDLFRRTNFNKDGMNIIEDRVRAATNIYNRLEKYGPVRAGTLVDDLTATGKPRFYLSQLEKANPKLVEQMRVDAMEEMRRKIQSKFFSDEVTKNPLRLASDFRKMLDKDGPTLRALFGEQYVTDLNSVARGLHLDANRYRISGAAPQLQGDVVRTSRTLMGPLSTFQRRVSAANWLRIRWHAKKATEVLSDPQSIRALQAARGFPLRSRPAVAAFMRSGILPSYGWDGNEIDAMTDEQYYRGLEFVDWLEEVQEEINASVEQE